MQQEIVHPLEQKYSFWVSVIKGQYGNVDFEDSLKLFGSFGTIEDFWGYYQHMVRPDALTDGVQLFLFQQGIRPVWEDETNKNGGRFIFRVRKLFSNKIWEDLMLSQIGEQCKYNDQVCGVSCHTKKGFIQMSVWIKDFDKKWEVHKEIQNWIFTILQLKERREIDFTFHPKPYADNKIVYVQKNN